MNGFKQIKINAQRFQIPNKCWSNEKSEIVHSILIILGNSV